MIASLPLDASAASIAGPLTSTSDFSIAAPSTETLDFVRARIAESFGVAETSITSSTRPCDLDPGPATGIFSGFNVTEMQGISAMEIQLELEKQFRLSLPFPLKMSVEEVATLIENELADPVTSKRLTRKRHIDSVLFFLDRVPNNGPIHDGVPDPTATAQAVNFVVREEQDIVETAIEMFISRFPIRNNLQTFLCHWLFPINKNGLSKAMILRDGFTFFLPPDNFDSSNLNAQPNTAFITERTSALDFRTDPIELPIDPMPTLEAVLSETDSSAHWHILKQFMVAAGMSFEVFSKGSSTPSELFQKIAGMGIALDANAGWYCGRLSDNH